MKRKPLRNILSIALVMVVLPNVAFAFERGPEYAIEHMSLQSVEGDEVLSDFPQDQFLVNIKVANTDADGAAILMLAQYSADGQMMDVCCLPMEIDLGLTNTLSVVLDNTHGQTDSIRGYVVSASESKTPLAEIYTYEPKTQEEDKPSPDDYSMRAEVKGNMVVIAVTGEPTAEDHIAVKLWENDRYAEMGNAVYTGTVDGARMYTFENTLEEDLTFAFQLMVGGQVMAEEIVVIPAAYVGPPWMHGGKQPWEYTWAEYEALDDRYKDAFFEAFEDADAFIEWMEEAQQEETESEKMPWEEGGKQPSEYTLAEFEALTGHQQMAFQRWFGDIEAFMAWMESAQNDMEKMPWEEGGKLPSEYSWEEFEALNDQQQMAFQRWFERSEDFEAWMESAQNHVEKMPWEEGGKQPSEYTLEEFEALSSRQQMAFQHWFGDVEAFMTWMEKAQGDAEKMPWEEGGKQPSEYSWEEFEALNDQQQMAFQHWFDRSEDFEAWMEAAQAAKENS